MQRFEADRSLFFRNLFNLLKDSLHGDCQLVAEGRSLEAHRFVLAAASPYFKNVFANLQNVEGKNILIFEKLTFCDLILFLHYVYNKEVNVQGFELQGFLRTLKFFGMEAPAETVKPKNEPVSSKVRYGSAVGEKRRASCPQITLSSAGTSSTEKKKKIVGKEFSRKRKAEGESDRKSTQLKLSMKASSSKPKTNNKSNSFVDDSQTSVASVVSLNMDKSKPTTSGTRSTTGKSLPNAPKRKPRANPGVEDLTEIRKSLKLKKVQTFPCPYCNNLLESERTRKGHEKICRSNLRNFITRVV